MGSVPLEASDVIAFTPGSLTNLANPPVFTLKAASRRERERYQRRIMIEGLSYHSQDSLRAETLNGLRALWSPDDFASWEGRLKQFWDAADQYAAAHGEDENPPPFEHEDQAVIGRLSGELAKAWEPLRVMGADNLMFSQGSPLCMLAVILRGWSGIAMPFALQAGEVSLDTLELLEEEMAEIERKALADNIAGVGTPGTAFLQLCAAAGGRLFLPRSAEKNSSSPAPSSATPPPSETGADASTGASTAQANSTETPAT